MTSSQVNSTAKRTIALTVMTYATGAHMRRPFGIKLTHDTTGRVWCLSAGVRNHRGIALVLTVRSA